MPENNDLDAELPELGGYRASKEQRPAPEDDFDIDTVDAADADADSDETDLDDAEIAAMQHEDDIDLDAHLSLASPIPTPASAHVPPERVRFNAPAVLSFDGYEETFDASIVNLSAQGVALSGPQGLAVHDKLRLQFRLSLGAESQSFLCQVIWVQNRGDDDASYGLHFIDLDDTRANLVLEAVRERVEGRASEWALPLIPPSAPTAEMTQSAASAQAPRMNPWLAAGAGLAAGIGLALLLTALTSSNDDVAPPPLTNNGEHAVAIVPSPGATAPEQHVAAQPETAPPPGHVVVPSTSPSVAPPAQPRQAERATATPHVVAEAPHVVPTPRPAARSSVVQQGDMRIEGSADRATLTLLTDGPVTEQQAFWLSNPTRLVVDVPRRQSTFERKLYELHHPLVSRVRVGQHPGKVRFVIETTDDTSSKFTARSQGNSVKLELLHK